MEPMVIARLVQAMAVRVGEPVLVAACGTGYGAALLASCGAAVTAFEEDDGLHEMARSALAAITPAVRLVPGRLNEGYGSEWGAILIEGAVPAIPPCYGGLLKQGSGRLVTVIAGRGRIGHAVLAEPTGAGLATRALFDCSTPVLPALLQPAGFAF
jgi:protein-L-isoaspartate(D-aspartate) O-methyltransferase